MARRFMPVKSGAVLTSGFGPRWGSVHRGADYGRDGGSGGDPVFAAQGGTVVYAGPASGFGGPDPAGWVVVDHPTADGSGTTVYGHIIREVTVGQRVEAGQRIGRINPNSATNGGVAPHLHFEVHPTAWAQGSQVDPVPWLAGAAWPDQTQQQEGGGTMGTLIGLDVSEWQDGLDLTATGADFCIIRTNYGSAHLDWVAVSHITDWRRTGKPYAYYSWLRPNQPIEAQADAAKTIWDACGGGAGVWIDVEEEGITRTQVVALRDALRRRGMYVIGAYSRANFWEALPGGEPSAEEGGGKIWVSHYGSRPDGPYRDIYPGDSSSIWLYPLGDRRPDLWQFTDLGRVPGWVKGVDVNAYKGTESELRALFTGTTTKKEEDFLMALSDDEQRRLLENTDYLRGQFGPHERLGYNDQGQPLTFIDWAKTQAVKLDYVFGQLRPWSQLGKDAQGRDLTLVDANAAQRYDLAALAQKVTDLITQLKEKN
ncbi:peptidoglycan DD-metalloendopeptidase family protein [Corynebacterium flavescens]|uniref:peptidoglycan DD-metalloendopeptidase family protein n=1 Tax=Corynebacterium flavescens TaxID=28028 RepID=UPI0026484688|nr:peptidoglycan DD-metalloendopeptidase family protein [Corynebacterium flavescens]MDN6199382.1 peptidoglycan DD-metalloendopeptidase family protein [Corynebacterium flavescens]